MKILFHKLYQLKHTEIESKYANFITLTKIMCLLNNKQFTL